MSVEAGLRASFEDEATRAGDDLESASARDILEWALDRFGSALCIAASMTDAVLIDLAARIRPGVDVVFLDTGYHFPETLRTARAVADRYDIRLHMIEPAQSTAEQDSLFGERLYARDPDACCNLRKIHPLRQTLAGYVAWATGIRRDETEQRRRIRVVEWDANRSMVKVNPLARWSQRDVDAYVDANDVVVNPLTAQGYPSIGCAPCTRRVLGGEDPRSGRWAGTGKTECGLHFGADGRAVRSSGEAT